MVPCRNVGSANETKDIKAIGTTVMVRQEMTRTVRVQTITGVAERRLRRTKVLGTRLNWKLSAQMRNGGRPKAGRERSLVVIGRLRSKRWLSATGKWLISGNGFGVDGVRAATRVVMVLCQLNKERTQTLEHRLCRSATIHIITTPIRRIRGDTGVCWPLWTTHGGHGGIARRRVKTWNGIGKTERCRARDHRFETGSKTGASHPRILSGITESRSSNRAESRRRGYS
jgi:hypothetical protein